MSISNYDFCRFFFFVCLGLSTRGITKIATCAIDRAGTAYKAAVDRGLQFSTEQYGCRQRNDFIKFAESVLVYVSIFLGSNRF